MSEPETAEAINEQAMRWVARLDQAAPTPELRAELDAWLAGDTRRQGAFLRAEAAWMALDRARGEALAGDEPAPSRRRLLAGGGALAASLVAGAGGWMAWRDRHTVGIKTATGEIRRVPLDDGSLAIVNTATQVKVNLRPELRAVKLDRGEAWFEVARDAGRPFVVAVGDVRVRAVGTAFSVRRVDGGAVVQVTEGLVETWCVGAEGEVVRVGPGGKAFVAPSAPPRVTNQPADQIDRTLAWRNGLIVLNGETLSQAAAEFNRHNERQIVILDPVLAAQTYVGRFRTNEPEAFVKAVTQTLDARVEATDEAFVVYRQ